MSQLSGQIFTAIALLTGGFLIARAKEHTRDIPLPAYHVEGEKSSGARAFGSTSYNHGQY
jgi:hypothetical protein